MKTSYKSFVLIGNLAFLTTISVHAQVFSEFQRARILPQGKGEVGVHYSPVWLGSDFDFVRTINDLGAQAALGVADGLEIRIRYDRLWFREEPIGEGYSNFMFTPKIRIVKDRLALQLPLSLSANKYDTGNWRLAPGLIYGLPLGQNGEINLASAYLIPLEKEEYGSKLVSVNLGFAIRNLGDWILRPETGIIFDPRESGTFWNIGLGVARSLGGK